ncbi:heme oxygenase-like domain-containing protein [Salipiger aestuarii]|uniref:biliverdin-producing heme oxygenase n=1 Tax=Salipiger aestuarii TaxID=568098 RepID=UPI00123BBC1F|nr:biliverdin-producing heme oxygenase [Salipiger aestuarii]
MRTPQDRVGPEGFRHALRLATRAAHDDSEVLFLRFTDSPGDTMRWFLAAQRAALAAICDSTEPARMASRPLARALLTRLDADLSALGGDARPVVPARTLHPMAADYLVLGSRLGTEVLRRALIGSAPPVPVPSYFHACHGPAMWRDHCALLNAVDPASDLAGDLTRDVIAGYDLFHAAAVAQLD